MYQYKESLRKDTLALVCEYDTLPKFIFSLQFVHVFLLQKAGSQKNYQ